MFLIIGGVMFLLYGASSIAISFSQDRPTQMLCDDMMDLMGDPIHNKLHENYVETMQLLHIYIEQCHSYGMYDSYNYTINGNMGMNTMNMTAVEQALDQCVGDNQLNQECQNLP